jgi:hypothetical protein
MTARSAHATPLTLSDLRRALDDKERELRLLIERRERLSDELDQLGETLQAMLEGGAAAPGRPSNAAASAARRGAATRGAKSGKRVARDGDTAAREGSLEAFVRAVLERVVGPLRVAEIVTAVKDAGYSSKSKNLNVIVSNRLAGMDDVEKVDRGLYQLRRDGAPSRDDSTREVAATN